MKCPCLLLLLLLLLLWSDDVNCLVAVALLFVSQDVVCRDDSEAAVLSNEITYQLTGAQPRCTIFDWSIICFCYISSSHPVLKVQATNRVYLGKVIMKLC